MRKALAVSSDIYFNTVGEDMETNKDGSYKIKKYLSLFGWDQKTGIDLPGEFSGLFPTQLGKKQQEISRVGWGYLQPFNWPVRFRNNSFAGASAYCAVANGGTYTNRRL